MALTDEDIREILRIIDESDLTELHIQTEGFSLHVRKGGGGGEASGPPSGSGRIGRRRGTQPTGRPGCVGTTGRPGRSE